jgi:hypothetical protein
VGEEEYEESLGTCVGSESERDTALLVLALLGPAALEGIVEARNTLLFLVGDDDNNVVRASEEGEGGADGEGEGEEDEEDEEGAPMRTLVRNRGNTPVLFHTRVSSPPSKSSSSDDNSSSTSVSPGPSSGFVSLAAATAAFVGVGRLYIGKICGGGGRGAGSCIGEAEGEHERGGSRWKVP